MNGYTRARVVLMGLVALVGLTAPASLQAQERAAAPIFLTLPETFPDLDARAVLMREPGRDIVILDGASAEPETLHVALLVLSRLRRERPPLADRGQLVPITGFASRGALSTDERARLASMIADLRERPLANVGNLGRGRWMRYQDR